jgi:hypothetical protein
MIVAAVPAMAQSQALEFTYTEADGQTFGAILDGTLASDGNHFVISGYQQFFINGQAVGFTPTQYFVSYASFAGQNEGYSGNGTGTVTLDGSYLDLFAEDENYNGFDLIYNDGAFDNDDVGTFGTFLGEGDNAYVQSDWSAELLDVPEPASFAAIVSGLFALGLARRHGARYQAAARLKRRWEDVT